MVADGWFGKDIKNGVANGVARGVIGVKPNFLIFIETKTSTTHFDFDSPRGCSEVRPDGAGVSYSYDNNGNMTVDSGPLRWDSLLKCNRLVPEKTWGTYLAGLLLKRSWVD